MVWAAETISTGTVQAGDEPWDSQGWMLGHGLGNVQILPDLHPHAGRTGLGRCRRGGELSAALPSDAMQEPVQTFAGILLHEAKENLSCKGSLEGLVHLLLSRGTVPQLRATST